MSLHIKVILGLTLFIFWIELIIISKGLFYQAFKMLIEAL